MKEPAIYIGMRVHHSPDPSRSHIAGQLDRDLVLTAGSKLHLRRDGDGYVLQIIPHKLPDTDKAKTVFALANAPCGALRHDPTLAAIEPPF